MIIAFNTPLPTPDFLRAHAAEVEALPFDGVVISPQWQGRSLDWSVWSRQAIPAEAVQANVAALQAVRGSRLMPNSLIRMNVTGDADVALLDAPSGVLDNVEAIARIARGGGCRGVLFDLEDYTGENGGQKFFGRLVAGDDDTMARLWGARVALAMQSAFPGLEVWFTMGRTYWRPASLLQAFQEGMLSVTGPVYVDGYERSYRFSALLMFLFARLDRTRGCRQGFGVWADWDGSGRMANAIRSARRVADSGRVWVYSQKWSWWPAGDSPVAPQPWQDDLRKALRA